MATRTHDVLQCYSLENKVVLESEVRTDLLGCIFLLPRYGILKDYVSLFWVTIYMV